MKIVRMIIFISFVSLLLLGSVNATTVNADVIGHVLTNDSLDEDILRGILITP